jgi:Flp pilus assembly protein TadB
MMKRDICQKSNKSVIVITNRGYDMAITMNWGALGLGAVVAFVVGWLIFGLIGAVILAVIILVLMGILKFK